MRDSLNNISQRIIKVGERCSLRTDEHRVPANASTEPLPPTASVVSKIKHDLLRISSPVPGTLIDMCENQKPLRAVPSIHSSLGTKRKSNEMPLSCHPPFAKSWLEVQPLRIHVPGQKANLRVDNKYSKSDPQSLQDLVTRKQSPRATTSRPYHGMILPPPPPIPQTRQRRRRSHSKPQKTIRQRTTPMNLLEQPIAPLTLHRRKITTPCPVQSPRPPGAGSIQTRSTPAENFKLFSELNDELDKVMDAYAPDETPSF